MNRASPASKARASASSAPPPWPPEFVAPPELLLDLPEPAAVTVKDTDVEAELPAEFEHDNVYVVVPRLVGATCWLPLVDGTLVQPPDAAQAVAVGVAAQVIVVEVPCAIDVAASVSEGAPGASVASALSAWMKPAPES